MFFALVLSAFSAYCNESSLQEGYVCCEDSPCEGHCIEYNGTNNKIVGKCVGDTPYQLCYKGKIFPVTMIMFCVPTIVFWIFACITDTNVPFCTWISNIGINICIAAIVQSSICLVMVPVAAAAIAFLSLGSSLFIAFYILVRVSPCAGGPECCTNSMSNLTKESHAMNRARSNNNCCECCSCCSYCKSGTYDPIQAEEEVCCGLTEEKIENTYDCVRFLRDVRAPRVSREELQSIMEENASIPATPKAIGIAFHKKDDGYSIDKREFEPINYSTWQENGNLDQIQNQKVIYCCYPRYVYNENMRLEIERALTAAANKVKEASQYYSSYDVFEVSGMIRRAYYGDSATFNTFPKTLYRILYEILLLIGYNGISDFFWNRNTQRIIFESVKEVSMDGSLRARFGERDQTCTENINEEAAKGDTLIDTLV